MKSKKILILAFIAALAVILCACGGGQNDVDITPTPEPAKESETPTPEPTEEPDTPTAIPTEKTEIAAEEIKEGLYRLQNSNGNYLVPSFVQSGQLSISPNVYNFWYIRPSDENYEIFYFSNSMNISGAVYETGTPVILFPSNQTVAHEKWRFYSGDGQSFQIVANQDTSLAVIPGDDGLILQDRTRIDNGAWTFVTPDGNPVKGEIKDDFLSIDAGSYYIQYQDGKYLSFEGYDKAETVRYILSENPFAWYVQYRADDDCYVIRQEQWPIKALNIAMGAYEAGTRVIEYPYSGTPNEQWLFLPVGDGEYQIAAAENDAVVVVPDLDGLTVLQDRSFAGDESHWQLIKVA